MQWQVAASLFLAVQVQCGHELTVPSPIKRLGDRGNSRYMSTDVTEMFVNVKFSKEEMILIQKNCVNVERILQRQRVIILSICCM